MDVSAPVLESARRIVSVLAPLLATRASLAVELQVTAIFVTAALAVPLPF